MYKPSLIAGIIAAMLAVILGAFGAHGLKNVTQDAAILEIYQKGVTYQFYHAFACLIAGILFASFPFGAVRIAGWLFVVGILLFSGSLYLITTIKIQGGAVPTAVGILTPIGGLFFIAGWISLLLGILKKA